MVVALFKREKCVRRLGEPKGRVSGPRDTFEDVRRDEGGGKGGGVNILRNGMVLGPKDV